MTILSFADAGKTAIEYRDAVGCPGYRVGSDGSVWSRHMQGHRGGMTNRWRRLKPWTNTTGYRTVALRVGGRYKKVKVHRLILEAFVGPCPNGMEGCHGVGGRLDNSVGNVRWDTRQENVKDRERHGTQTHGEDHATAILGDDQIAAIRLAYRPRSSDANQYVLAEKFGISQGHVSNIINSQRRSRTGVGKRKAA